MTVLLHVYDVMVEANDNMNSAIQSINKLGRDTTLGGVFHGGVEVHGAEYSFGYCPQGTGVYKCEPRQNPMYKYRDTVDLGECKLSREEVRAVVKRMSREWPGDSYDILTRNCCHFCEAFCQGIETSKPVPLWLNRMAGSVNAAIQTYKTCADGVQKLTSGISQSFKWLTGAEPGSSSSSASLAHIGSSSRHGERSGCSRPKSGVDQAFGGMLAMPKDAQPADADVGVADEAAEAEWEGSGHLVSRKSAPA